MMLTSLYILYVYVAVIGENYLHLYLKNAIAVLLCMIIINNGVYANICYYYMNNEYETTYANSVEIMNRIHSLDTSSQKIAIIGNNLNIYQLRESDKNYKVPMLSQLLETNLLYDQEHIIMFINHTYHTKYEGVSNSILIKLEKTDYVKNMKSWPSPDSIKLQDDIIIIKLSNNGGAK